MLLHSLSSNADSDLGYKMEVISYMWVLSTYSYSFDQSFDNPSTRYLNVRLTIVSKG